MSKTILVVDDIKTNIDLLTNILRPSYSIMAAVSGEDAIEILKTRKPDLVLLDVYMPGIDGFGVLSYMRGREDLSTIPVIFVTGEHNADAEEKGLLLGAVDYIKKPFNASIVSAKVHSHLELKSYRDSLELLVKERTRELENRTRELEESTRLLAASREAIIMGMSLMSESHDKVTGEHIERIKYFTKIITERMMELYPNLMAEDMASQIVLFSPLHDIGKISISDTILKKAGVLTPEEYNIMKQHTVEGASLLRKTESFFINKNDGRNLSVAIEIAECHHERYDGTGYPHGLAGEDIPLSARIVALADVYDALRSPRSYKKAFTHEESVDIILNGDEKTSPAHFDPKVSAVFSTMHKEFERNY